MRAISQGIDSQDEQSEVLWTVHGLVDSLYLKELAKKTHRGLEGAVRRNLHAGGRCYGYQNVPVDGGVELRVSESEAQVVVRIFEMAANGRSLKEIAKTLNADGIASPRPRAGRVQGGWCPTAIREMLRRELYIGHQVWNRSTFVKRPGTNRRIARARPPSEWVVIERPELRIIEEELWQRVHSRLTALYAIYGLPNRKGLLHKAASSHYLLTGIARCGLCGANIVIVTGRGPTGHPKYGCPHNFYRGTCANNLKERHDLLEKRLFAGLQEAILRPEVIEYAVQEFGRQLQQALADVTDDMDRFRSRKESLEAEVRRITDAIAVAGHSDSLLRAITERESEIREIDQRILSSRPNSVESKLKDLRQFVTERLKDIHALLYEDPVRAKNELVKHVEAVTLRPEGSGLERHYVAEGEWDLLGDGKQRVRVVAGARFEPLTGSVAVRACPTVIAPPHLHRGWHALQNCLPQAGHGAAQDLQPTLLRGLKWRRPGRVAR